MAEPAKPYLLTPTYRVSGAERLQVNLFASRTASLTYGPQTEQRTDGLLVDGTFGDEDATFWLSSPALRALTPDASAIPDLSDLPPALLTALAHLALEPATITARDELGRNFRVQSAKFADLGPGMTIEVPCGETEHHALLRLPAEAIGTICADLATRPHVVRADNMQRASVTLLFEAGRMTMDLADLAGLREGDALLAETDPAVDQAGISLLRDETLLGVASVTDNQIELRQWRMEAMADLETDTPDPAPGEAVTEAPADAQGLPIHDVTVTLRFCLASQDLTVADLGRIGEGHVFDLDRPLDGLVQIYAGKKRLGTGELVSVADRVGVRLSRLMVEDDG